MGCMGRRGNEQPDRPPGPYGIGADQVPRQLGEIEGSLIELLDINGIDGLRVYDTADMRDPPVCFRWAAPDHRLVRQSCNGIGSGKMP